MNAVYENKIDETVRKTVESNTKVIDDKYIETILLVIKNELSDLDIQKLIIASYTSSSI